MCQTIFGHFALKGQEKRFLVLVDWSVIRVGINLKLSLLKFKIKMRFKSSVVRLNLKLPLVMVCVLQDKFFLYLAFTRAIFLYLSFNTMWITFTIYLKMSI